MPRTKSLSDGDVLKIALKLIHEAGPEALTFDALARACGLSPATLVQRFSSKADLKRATLKLAWDELEARTAALARSTSRTPAGAIDMLVALSGGYGGIEAYAEGLLLLREDFRDPELRARGTAWKESLSSSLDQCFASSPGAPSDIGLLLATQWQGSLLWWAFDPRQSIEVFVRAALQRFLGSVLATGSI